MKKYDEMAEAVFRRIEKYNMDQQRKRKHMARMLVPVVCACLVIFLGIGIWQGGLARPHQDGDGDRLHSNPMQTQPSATSSSSETLPNFTQESTNPAQPLPAEPFVYLCAKRGDGQVTTELIQMNQSYESGIYLDFVTIEGLTEGEIMEKVREYETGFQNFLSQYEVLYGAHHGVLILREAGYIVPRMTWNFFTLDLDFSKVKTITISNTAKYGQIDVFCENWDPETQVFPHGQSITLEKEQISENISFSWNYTRLNNYMEETENPTCTDFNDAFRFSVEFDDGTIATATIEIQFQDSGQAIISCRDYQLVA